MYFKSCLFISMAIWLSSQETLAKAIDVDSTEEANVMLEETSNLNDQISGISANISVDLPISTSTSKPERAYSKIVDAKLVFEEYHRNKNNATKNWRIGLKFSETLSYMLNNSQQTDCVFIVGQDNNTEEIEAHAVILASASPVFEDALKKSTAFRISDYQPSEFRKILSFIYRGKLCIDDFDEACALLKHAQNLELLGAREAAHDFIIASMYPERPWHAYQCANQANDEQMTSEILKVITAKTSDALKDPKFADISKEDLEKLLERDDLAISSETEVFDAVMGWGMIQVRKTGLKITPQLIREKIGTNVLKSIRFLTMTGSEFSKMHTVHNLLDYEESLAVLLNINNPGIIAMPKTLSSSTTNRSGRAGTLGETFISMKPQSSGCSSTYLNDYYDRYTTTVIPNTEPWNLVGIQIPKSLESRSNCNLEHSLEERFDIQILDANNKVIKTVLFNEVATCQNERYFKSPPNGNYEITTDSMITDIKFDEPIIIPTPNQPAERYKVTIFFHDVKEYPTYVPTGITYGEYETIEMQQMNGYINRGYNYYKYRLMENKSFVYAIITE